MTGANGKVEVITCYFQIFIETILTNLSSLELWSRKVRRDQREVIRSCKSKKDRQHNGQ